MRRALLLFALALGRLAAYYYYDAAQDLLDASRRGDLAAVKSALEASAPVEAKTRYGQTPLFLASMNGHVEVVRLLLDKGAAVDVSDTFYKGSVIGFTASRNHVEVLKLLIPRSQAADANLDTAVRAEKAELVALVLEGKAKPSQAALDRNYELALPKHAELAALLKKAGAQPPAPAVVIDAKTLESYSGTYKSDTLPLDIKVSGREGKLYLQATGQPEFAPKAKSPTLFEFTPAMLQVEFTGPGAFVLRQAGQTFQFKKAVTP